MPKFKNFKDKKNKLDQVKNNMFVKLAKEIYVEAKRGGVNPDANFKLKTAIANARQFNMPNDTIERAIKKASGDNDADNYEEIYYEGYGPGGTAIMVKSLTDNRNRSAADIRSIFNKRGGNMGESGCVSYMFDEKGLLTIDREDSQLDEDTLMLQAIEAGADDLLVSEDVFEITTSPQDFEQVKTSLEEQGIRFVNAQISWIPQTTVEVTGENEEKLRKMMDSFDDCDDVQDVYTNFILE